MKTTPIEEQALSKVFLTGANGHIGANIARELLKRNHQVVAFVRQTSNLRGLDGLNVELRYGDILDQNSVAAGAQGCDAIIHTAAVYRMWAKDDQKEIIDPTIRGAQAIFDAAHANGIKRLVYTSSSAAIGGARTAGEVRTERNWNDSAQHPYYIAKTRSERLAHQLADQYGIELIAVNPTTVMGPFDFNLTPSNVLLKSHLNGEGLLYDGNMAIVHVNDVARLHVDALSKGTPGQRYIANGHTITLKTFGQYLERLFGVKSNWLKIPRPVGNMLGYVQYAMARITGKPPIYDHRSFHDFVSAYGNFDNARSIATFGIEYASVETILADTAAWLIHLGEVQENVAERLRADYPRLPEWA
jgi:dihydroflavonol-4-reductase